MTTVRSIEELDALIKSRIHGALEKTAEEAVGPIRARVPVAFGELRDSVHAVSGDVPRTVVDAPHAAPVEIGSLPHTPDFARLLAWVKLRGMQGLNTKKVLRKMGGPTTTKQAKSVAKQIKELQVGSNRRRVFLKSGKKNPLAVGRHTPIDAAEQVAMAISRKIQAIGTNPHWFVLNSLPAIEKILNRQMKQQ